MEMKQWDVCEMFQAHLQTFYGKSTKKMWEIHKNLVWS